MTVLPESLIDENLLKVAGGATKHKPAGTFGGTRLKKCHWQGTSKWFLDHVAPHTPWLFLFLAQNGAPRVALVSPGGVAGPPRARMRRNEVLGSCCLPFFRTCSSCHGSCTLAGKLGVVFLGQSAFRVKFFKCACCVYGHHWVRSFALQQTGDRDKTTERN